MLFLLLYSLYLIWFSFYIFLEYFNLISIVIDYFLYQLPIKFNLKFLRFLNSWKFEDLDFFKYCFKPFPIVKKIIFSFIQYQDRSFRCKELFMLWIMKNYVSFIQMRCRVDSSFSHIYWNFENSSHFCYELTFLRTFIVNRPIDCFNCFDWIPDLSGWNLSICITWMSQRSWRYFKASLPNFPARGANKHERNLLHLEISMVLFLCGYILLFDHFLFIKSTYFGYYYK